MTRRYGFLTFLAGLVAAALIGCNNRSAPTDRPAIEPSPTVAVESAPVAVVPEATASTVPSPTVVDSPTPTATPPAEPTATATRVEPTIAATATRSAATPTASPTPTPRGEAVERPVLSPTATAAPVGGAAAAVLVLGLDQSGRIVNFGSGVAAGPEGLILTSAAAVQGARQLAVRLPSGESGPAQTVLSDPALDLVVLRTSVEPLPPVRLAGASGQSSPSVVAAGYVSASAGLPRLAAGRLTGNLTGGTSRSATAPDRLSFTAAAAPGFSGGPLLNAAGEVIGVITIAVAGESGFAEAVPIERAQDLLGRARSGAVDAVAPVQRVPAQPTQPADEVAAIIDRYYADLQQGNVDQAYQALTASARAAQTLADFARQPGQAESVEYGPPVIASVSERDAVAQVQTSTLYRSGGQLYRQHWQITWYLKRENGAWHRESIDRYPLTAPTPISR